MEIEEITRSTDTDVLLRISAASNVRRMWEEIRDAGVAAGDEAKTRIANSALDEDVVQGLRVGDVSPLHSLAATHCLVQLLTGQQWVDMRDARERGTTWQEIGDVTGMTRQGACNWYKRSIARQEKYVPDLHDTDRARAALASDDHDQEEQ